MAAILKYKMAAIRDAISDGPWAKNVYIVVS